jgi:hypothetical protein
MILPVSMKIAGLRWRVLPRARIIHDGKRADGLCKPDEQELLVSSKIDGVRKRRALLHEALHAMFWDDVAVYENEPLILKLEERMDAMLEDNPEFRGMY